VERQESTLGRLIEYLLAHGYPEESLAIEFPIGGKYRADIAVVDPTSRLPVAILELKRYDDERSRSLGRQQLDKFLKALGTQSVQTYLVWTTNEPPYFEIERYVPSSQDGETEAREQIEGIPFDIQRQSVRSGRIEEKRKKERSWRRGFIACSGSLAAILFALLGLELAGVVRFGTASLLILGGASVALLLPFYERIKFYGIELNRVLGGNRGDNRGDAAETSPL